MDYLNEFEEKEISSWWILKGLDMFVYVSWGIAALPFLDAHYDGIADLFKKLFFN